MKRPFVRSRSTLSIILISSTLAVTATNPAFANADWIGQVVDPHGGAVVRAHVRLLDASGREVAATVTRADGRFTFATPSCTGCRIEVARTGFVTTTMPLPATPVELRIALPLAPVADHVVVSATLDAVPASQTGTSVTVLTSEEITRRGAPFVADLLRTTPSVTVVRTGGLGGVTSLFIRAGESNYNKVLLDGIPLNEPGGTFNFGALSSAFLDRIEILRGAHSALFGSDAMASVVQLFTRRRLTDSPRPELEFTLEGGTYATRRTAASVSGRRAGWDYFAGGSQFVTDNRVPNNELDSVTGAWNTGGRAGGVILRGVGRIEHERVGTPGAVAFGRPDLDAFFKRQDIAAGFSVNHSVGAFSQRAIYSLSHSDQTSSNLIADPPFVPEFRGRVGVFTNFDFLFDSHNVLRRHHVSYQADWRLGRSTRPAAEHFVTFAGDWDGERARLENRMAGTLLPASRNNAGLTVQHQLAARYLTLATSARVEHNDSFGTVVVPRIAAALTARDASGTFGRTTIRVNAGRGVKEPTALQSFSPNPGFQGNPDLLPERSRSVDIGVEQRFFGDRLRIDAVAYDNDYRRQISTVTLGFSPFRAQYFNIGHTHARGLELTADAVPHAAVRVRGGYSLVASEIVDACDDVRSRLPFECAQLVSTNPLFQPGAWAFRRPRHSGFVELAWTESRVSVSVLGTFVGRRVETDFGTFDPSFTQLDAYAIWRAGVRVALHRRVELLLDIDNITNTDYMEPLGYLTWERTARAGVRLRW